MSRTFQRTAGILGVATLFAAGPIPVLAQYGRGDDYYSVYEMGAQIRCLVTPREASVYVDGFYAGIVDDFDGLFQRLPVTPGGHEIVLHLDGYRTVHQTVYAMAGSTFKVQHKMEKLSGGESSEPPPVAPPVSRPPAGSGGRPWPPPGAAPPSGPPPTSGASSSDQGNRASNLGTLAINVQPAGAQIVVDGEPWAASDERAVLVVQVAEGRHRIEIRKDGFRPFTGEVSVNAGETTPVNVSLSPE